MNEELLQLIIDQLKSRKQAASYGALAGAVGSTPQQVMAGRPRNARHSWVVNTRTELPTDYAADEMDEELLTAIAARGVIRTPEDLEIWLAKCPTPVEVRDGAELVAFWRAEGLVGSRQDIHDSQAHARTLREQAQRRGG